MNVVIKRYISELSQDWSTVLASSRNGIFLFDRKYIEYHSSRFIDFSAVAYLDGEPVALFPASIDLASFHASSHAGLTFGGIVLKRELRGDVAIILINALLDSLKDWGAKTLTIKLMPQVFCTYPSSDVDYALWRRGFTLVRRDLSSILPLSNSLHLNKTKLQAVRKAKKAGLAVGTGNVRAFHPMLEQVLRTQHGVSPVHSLVEMEFLALRFPDQIFIRGATKDHDLLAGMLIFNYEHIWHTQYLASSELGRAHGALDLVMESVIDEARIKGVEYLSFGISTESAGMVLNAGLLLQKESYGARSIVHDFMEATL